MSVSLYELSEQYRAFLDEDIATEEDMQAFNDLVGGLEDEITVKCINLGYVIKTLRYEQDMLKAEEAALHAKRKTRENKEERLLMYLKAMMKGTNTPVAEAVDIKVSIAKTPVSLVFVDEGALPDEYWKQAEPTVDRRALLAHVKENPDCTFAMAEAGETVRIK